MAAIFVSLPVPATPGVGASIPVNTMGALKTIVVDGPSGADGELIIEGSANGGASFAPLTKFFTVDNPPEKTLSSVLTHMRARRHSGSGPAFVAVGGQAVTTNLFGALSSVPVNTSALGPEKTIVVSAPYQGRIVVEASNDGANYAAVAQFDTKGPDVQHIAGDYLAMRLRTPVPGGAQVSIGAGFPFESGGGGGGTAEFTQETVTNEDVSDFVAGEVVRIAFDNGVVRAQADALTSVEGTVGVTTQAIAQSASGIIANSGKVQALMDSGVGAASAGQRVWLSPAEAGRITNTQPGRNDFPLGVIKDINGFPLVTIDLLPEQAINAFVSVIAIGNEADASGSNATIAIGNSASTSGSTDTVAIGTNALGGENNAVAVGANSSVTGPGAVAVGGDAVASTDDAVAIGRGSTAVGTGSLALGPLSTTGSAGNIAIGSNSSATPTQSMAVGDSATATNTQATAVGYTTVSSGIEALAVGYAALASGPGAVGLGSGVVSSADSTVAVGRDAFATSADAIAIGHSSNSGANGAIAIGDTASASDLGSIAIGQDSTASGSGATAVGPDSTASGDQSTSIGNQSTASNTGAVALGNAATASAQSSVSVGSESTASGLQSTTIGHASSVTHADSVCVGFGAASTTTNQLTAGSAASPINQIVTIGTGALNAINATIVAAADGDTGLAIVANTGGGPLNKTVLNADVGALPVGAKVLYVI